MLFPEVTLYEDGAVAGEIAGYSSLEYTFSWSGVDTCTVTVPGDVPALTGLDGLEGRWVDLVVSGGPRPWAGHVTEVEIQLGREGLTTVVTAVSGRDLLNRLLVYPSPGDSVGAQRTATEFEATGPVDTVVGDLVSTIARARRVPLEWVATPTTGRQVVTAKGRMAPLLDVLTKAVAPRGLAVAADLYYPETADTLGVPPTGLGVIVVRIVAPRRNDWATWEERDLIDGALTITPAAVSSVVVGGPGKGTERKYGRVSATAPRMGRWAGLELYSDRPDPDGDEFDPATDDTVATLLARNSGTVTATVTVEDGSPHQFGRDYLVGDIVAAEIGGHVAKEMVTRVRVKADYKAGLTVTPTIGDNKPTPIGRLVETVAGVARSQAEQRRAL